MATEVSFNAAANAAEQADTEAVNLPSHGVDLQLSTGGSPMQIETNNPLPSSATRAQATSAAKTADDIERLLAADENNKIGKPYLQGVFGYGAATTSLS